ncbi:hypothetical protein [Emticicia agri]|nr:hypothetical protein [Emticicia agri]
MIKIVSLTLHTLHVNSFFKKPNPPITHHITETLALSGVDQYETNAWFT